MTKQINKTIRSLKRALKELKTIKLEDYILENGCQVQGTGKSFNEYVTEAQFQLEVILNDLEEEYQKLHQIGSHKL